LGLDKERWACYALSMPTNFRRIINKAYQDILERPADEGGLSVYNSAVNAGLSEANLRESLLRSAEYAEKNPEDVSPPVGTMTPLRVEGNRFHNAAGPVKLLGCIVCCDDPATPADEAHALGWPLVNTLALDAMKAHKLNYTDIRLGPSINRDVFGEGEPAGNDGYLLDGNKYDLNQWNPAFWSKVRQAIADAEARGVYVCVSVIDSWVLDHELTPWSGHRNRQGYEGGSLAVVKHAPTAVHERWIRKVVRETCAFPNVLYLDGNESWKGNPELSWLHGIRDIARDEMGANKRVFGSNSEGITESVDFLAQHNGTVPVPGALPKMETEYKTHTLPIPTILSRAKQAWDLGTVSFMYWAGEHSVAQRAEVYAGLKDIVEGGGVVVPVPDKCPWLVKMGFKVHHVTNGSEIVPIPSVGSSILFDLTPRFSHNQNDVNGKPCNSEHNVVCGGRECEDPRGGVWSIVSGNAQIQSAGNPFQFKIRLVDAEPVRVRCEPWPDYRDAEGKLVRVGPNCPRELTVQAGVKPSATGA
jgi:hypothetical protein